MLSWKNSNKFLSVFRGLTFLLAVVQTLTGYSALRLSPEAAIVLIMVGVYSVGKILIPFRWYQKDRLTYLVLASDVVLCLGLAFFTGGLSSAFLLYSLNPILTMGLMLNRPAALTSGVLAASTITAAQILPARLGLAVTSSLSQPSQYVGALIVYALSCYMAAYLPFLINSGMRLRIQASATTDERNRLAREMHDNLAQSVGFLKLKAKELKNSLGPDDEHIADELRQMVLVLDELYTDIRESLGLLRINTLENAGLAATLSDQVNEFGQRTGIKATFTTGENHSRLSTLGELQVLRVVQEALTNVRKHAEAKSVEVCFDSENHWTHISIDDDGKGFNYDDHKMPGDGEHIGLKVMEERIASLGGRMTVDSWTGYGTHVSCLIPESEEVARNGRGDKVTAGR